MQYEKQKAACAEYAQRNGGSVADVLRTNGHKGTVVLSKDGRTIYDPFVIEPIAEVITAEPMKEMEKAIEERVKEEVVLEAEPVAPAPQEEGPRTQEEMTDEIRNRYESALETLRSIVARTGDNRDRIQALIRDAASRIADALERDPGADIEDIIQAFRGAVEAIVMENMREAAREAEDDESEGIADVSLALTFSRVDIEAPIQRYASALSQEVKWFVAGGFAAAAIRDYMKDPLSFLAAESIKPAQKGKPTRQTAGRMTLAPVFVDGKRRRSLSEVLADFRSSITAVGSGNSYQVGKSAWMLLNVTSMQAYNDALASKWTGRGAVGFYVYRASTYDCPSCDEQCGRLHPMTDETPPYHPHCVCCMVEAYATEMQEDFEI